jgi:hypothetical protein
LTYYVLAVDGKTYGPVDAEGLKRWVEEGRIVPTTRLREADSGREVTAGGLAELHALFRVTTVPPRTDGQRCPYCGGGMAPGQAQCFQCGTVLGAIHQPRSLITGSLIGDRLFGFVVGFFSWFLYGIGGFGAIILYFILQRSYPVFARSLGFGILSIVVLLLGAFALCLVAISGARW